MSDINIINLNMLFMRYGDVIMRELHVPLGPLYQTRASTSIFAMITEQGNSAIPIRRGNHDLRKSHTIRKITR